MTSFGKKIISFLVMVLVAGGVAWYFLNDSPEGDDLYVPNPSFNFSREGRLAKDNPGMEKGEWYLVWDEPGAAGKNIQLRFSDVSVCAENGHGRECEDVDLEAGMEVNIQGVQSGDRLDVTYLTIL